MASNKSLSVAEYSDVVIKKYLHQAYSEHPRENLTKAAEEMYVLLRKLTDAAGGKSEDAKAPLKAIRNALDTIVSNYSEGTASPEVDSLFNLCRRLQELCEERILTNTDPIGGQQVQDHLRYRLTRLVTGSAWDAHIELKLHVLRLIFSFMVKENERLLEEARGVPSLKLGRTLSIGRGRGSRDLGPAKVSKWSEAIDEIGRLPGSKLVPLMKLLLADNMQMHTGRVLGSGTAAAGGAGAGAEEGFPATPNKDSASVGPHTGGKGSPEVQAMNASLLNDLLGLSINENQSGGGTDSRQQQDPATGSRRSSSPAPSSVAPSDDPFAASMGEARSEASYGAGNLGGVGVGGGDERMMMQQRMPMMSSGLGPRSSSGTMSHTSAPPPGIPTPPSSGYYPAAAIPTGATGHFGGPGGRSSSSAPQQAYGSQNGGSLPPSSPAYHQQQMMHQHQYHQQQMQMQQHQHQHQQPYQMQRMGSGGGGNMQQPGYAMYSTPPHGNNNVYNTGEMSNFDAASPYLGMTEPFETHYFQDVAPLPDRKPVPLPSSPPMRGGQQ